jgi:histidyl-tRNA synthetase
VFEIYDQSPDNRRAMFGGGRYDNLVGMFGKESLSGVGFGMGDVSLQNFLETHQLIPAFESEVDVMVTLPDEIYAAAAAQLVNALRSSGLNVVTPLAVGNFGAQLKQATKLDARIAVLFGEEEWKLGKVLIKNLTNGQQDTVMVSDVVAWVKKLLK